MQNEKLYPMLDNNSLQAVIDITMSYFPKDVMPPNESADYQSVKNEIKQFLLQKKSINELKNNVYEIIKKYQNLGEYKTDVFMISQYLYQILMQISL